MLLIKSLVALMLCCVLMNCAADLAMHMCKKTLVWRIDWLLISKKQLNMHLVHYWSAAIPFQNKRSVWHNQVIRLKSVALTQQHH